MSKAEGMASRIDLGHLVTVLELPNRRLHGPHLPKVSKGGQKKAGRARRGASMESVGKTSGKAVDSQRKQKKSGCVVTLA